MEYMSIHGVRVVYKSDMDATLVHDYVADNLEIVMRQDWELALNAIDIGCSSMPPSYSGGFNYRTEVISVAADYLGDDFTLLHELVHSAHHALIDISYNPFSYMPGERVWFEHEEYAVQRVASALRRYSASNYAETVADIAAYHLSAKKPVPEFAFDLYDKFEAPPLNRNL